MTTPRRLANTAYRTREYLAPDEVARVIKAARERGRHQHRDATLILIAYRHGLRVSELVSVRWDQVDLAAGHLHVSRLKNGVPSVHPLRGPELRALRKLKRDYPDAGAYLFATERGGPMTPDKARKVVQRAGAQARIGFRIHPHMLRHAAGYKLANDRDDTRAIQLYLGHRNIQHTVHSTELAPTRFKDFWQD